MEYFKRVRFDEVITNSFLLVKKHLRELISLVAAPMSISFLSQYGLGLIKRGSQIQFMICVFLYILSHYFIYIVMVHVVSLIVLQKDWDNHSVYKEIFQYPMGEVFGTVGLFLVVFLTGPFLIFLTGQAMFFIPSAVAGVLFAFFLPISILKKLYYKESLMESYKIVSVRWLRVFLFYAMGTLLFGLAFFGLTMLFSNITKFILPSSVQAPVFTAIFFFNTVVFGLIEHTFHTLFFFSIRNEHENYSIEDLRNEVFPPPTQEVTPQVL